MSFWSNVEAALAVAVKAVGAEIVTVATYFKPIVIAGAEELAEAALQAVLAEAPKVISGAEKLSSATSTVLTTLGAQGKSIAVSDASAAVQAAYNAIAAAAHPTAN